MDGSSSDMPMNDHIPDVGAPLREPRDERVVAVHQPGIAIGRVDAVVDIAKGAEPVDANPHILRCGFPAFQFLYSVEREHFRRFADLAFFERAAPVPGTGGSVEVVLERAREFSGSREARLQGDIGDALSRRCFHQQGGSFQPHTPHVAVQRLARDALKNAVEVERREAADAGQPGQRKFAIEMLRDIVEHAIDPVVIVLVAPHIRMLYHRMDGIAPGVTWQS